MGPCRSFRSTPNNSETKSIMVFSTQLKTVGTSCAWQCIRHYKCRTSIGAEPRCDSWECFPKTNLEEKLVTVLEACVRVTSYRKIVGGRNKIITVAVAKCSDRFEFREQNATWNSGVLLARCRLNTISQKVRTLQPSILQWAAHFHG